MYNLAAETDSPNSFKFPLETQYINGTIPTYICNILEKHLPHARYFQANSIELFKGIRETITITTDTLDFYPKTPYGIGKLQAYWITRFQREHNHNYHVNGILSNVESRYRRGTYVTKKIANFFKAYSPRPSSNTPTPISLPLLIGNPNIELDWIHAHDVARAMYIIMQQDTLLPESDYMITSGKLRTIKTLTTTLARLSNVDGEWRGDDFFDKEKQLLIIKGNSDVEKRPYLQKQQSPTFDNNSLVQLGWTPTVTFEDMCNDLLQDPVSCVM